jgi:uncharacterized protein
MVRVVIDTNVLVSAFLNNGKSRKFVLKAPDSHTLVLSSQMLAELADVLSREKFSVKTAQIDRFISNIVRQAIMVFIGSRSKIVLDDPDDDIVIETALSGEADFIVSGDKHLLKIGCHKHVHIVSVNEFTQITAKKPLD